MARRFSRSTASVLPDETSARRRRLLGVLPGAALVAATAGPRAALAARTLIDDAQREVVLGSTPARVFPAGPPASVFVYCLAPDKLLGWPRRVREDEAAFLLPEAARLPELGRLTGRGSTAALETVLALRTQLVVDVGSTAPTYASLADQVQRQTGVPYVLYDGAFDRTEQTIRRLADALGVTARGESLARGVRAILDAAAGLRGRLAPGERPRVYFARGPDGLATAAAGGLNAEVLDEVGAVNVAQVEAPNLARVSFEQLLSWRPDWILASDESFFHGVRAHPVWSRLEAVRAGRVLLVPHLPFGWFDAPPALNRMVGIVWLSAVFHPRLVGYRLDERIVEVFEWLYHRRPSLAQVRRLLGEQR
ncbi:MAG: iron ABC transporter substrate-binding protein [Burkholderiales bacterium]|jgi:iron complex transport system substrate-binding protein|nr:MAG: iron ABC transporter substrate-binding protein [Burkholderiales bacterium]